MPRSLPHNVLGLIVRYARQGRLSPGPADGAQPHAKRPRWVVDHARCMSSSSRAGSLEHEVSLDALSSASEEPSSRESEGERLVRRSEPESAAADWGAESGDGGIESVDKPYYVTTPIFYVNASPHIGHLHSLLLTDILFRYHQLRYRSSPSPSSQIDPSRPQLVQRKTRASRRPDRFSTGTDEHGLKIQKAAAEGYAREVEQLESERAHAQRQGEEAATNSADRKILPSPDPQIFCDRISQRFRSLATASGVSNTDFVRTSGEGHKAAVRYFWDTLQRNGHIYKGSHSGWYAVSDECFYTETQVEDRADEKSGIIRKVAIESGSPVEWSEEENYKFRLSAFQDGLIEWLQGNPRAVHPPTLHATLLASLQTQPLQDLSISRPRSRLTWGVPVPGDEENHTIYVWVDALVNYLTVLGYPWKDARGEVASAGKQGASGVEHGWPVDVHVVGKDIVRFHAIYWPALLLAAGLPLPRQVLSHAHWTQGRTKMSKSKGNVVDPFVAMQDGTGLVGREGVRWYLMRAGGSLERDADYSDDQLYTHYNLLASQIGNLLSRISNPKLLVRFLDAGAAGGKSASMGADSFSDEEPTVDVVALENALLDMGERFEVRMKGVEVTRALEGVMEIVAEANKIFTLLAPWSSTCTPGHVRRSISLAHESLRRAGILLSIVMPEKMGRLLDRLGVPADGRGWSDSRSSLMTEDEMDVAVSKMILRQKVIKSEGVLFPSVTVAKAVTA